MKILPIFFFTTTLFIGYNNLQASQAHAQSSSSASSGSAGGWLRSWFVSAPTEQQKKIAAIVGERATERQKKLADVLYDATLLPEDLIKIIVAYDAKIFSKHSGAITALVALSHGRLASASADKTVKIWDIEGDHCLQTLEGHTETITALAVLENDQLASGASDNTIRIWDLKLVKCKILTLDGPKDDSWFFPQNNRITALTSLPNNKLASGFYIPPYGGNVIIWDLTTGKQICFIPHACHALSVLPNGNLAAGINTATYSETNTFESFDIILIDPTSGQSLTKIDNVHAFDITALAALPNNKLASASFDYHIKAWDLQTRKEINRYSPYNILQRLILGSSIFLSLLPNNQLASGWADKKIRIIDLDTMKCIRTLEGHTGAVTALAALPTGQLASGSDDGTVRIWNLEQEEKKQ